MADQKPSVLDQLALLKASFGDKLVERIEEIEAAAIPLSQEGASEDEMARAVDTLQALSHKLTGSAGTFGFAAISDASRKLERKSGNLKEAKLTPADCRELLDLLADVAAIVENRDREPEEVADVERPDVTENESPRLDEELAVLYFGEPKDAEGGLAARLLEFGFRLRHQTRHDVKCELGADDFAAVIVDLDSSEWQDASTEALAEISALSMGAIALSNDTTFERRLGAVRSGFQNFLASPADVTSIVDAIDRNISEREPDPYRVLIVDDDLSVAKYVEVVLGAAGMITTSVTDPFAVMDAIREFCPELILLDLNMPGCSGAELASVIRQEDSLSSVSIVFLSSESDPSLQIAAMHTGGDDFLPKALRAEHLVSAVEARAKRFRQIRSMLVSDSLTGLLNHTATKHQIETEISRAKREKSLFSLVFIDIDHFKAVNDTYGHGLGDQVIRSLALLLKQRFRSTDVIGRLGGEEFGVVLSGTGRDDAERIVNEVRETFAAMQFEAEDGRFSSSFSAGVSTYPEWEMVKSLCDAADQALYTAKDTGRNRVVINEP
ncbi:MAG: diguanylate cyclase [Alphaproteobacteria bacterium]|jgi:diguanylate cyclase (GGDEF)-like protein|nr:diguanylate cyclase [Alphaproteobacteria bacterium]